MKLPSRTAIDEKERKLGLWLSKNKKMVSEIPSVSTTNKEWNSNFEELKKFVIENGHLPSQDTNSKLINWVANQRRKVNKLDAERIATLESLPNWQWSADFKGEWDKSFDKILRFVKKNNRLPSQSAKERIEKKMAMWIQNQKRKKNGFTREKVMIINLIETYK